MAKTEMLKGSSDLALKTDLAIDTFGLTEKLALQVFDRHPKIKKSVLANLDELRESFGYETATPVERLLISQVITCWAQYLVVGYLYELATGAQYDIALAEHLERRYGAAHSRFIKSVEALARVQKLNLPAIQINFAEQQVNVSR